MPVHRAPGGKRSGVFAYMAELDAWLCPGMEAERSAPWSSAHRLNRPSDRNDWGAPAGMTANSAAEAATRRTPRQLSRLRWIAIGALCLAATLAAILVAGRARMLLRPQAIALRPSSHHEPAEAEQLYLRGRYLWDLRTADSLAKAIEAYRQAIAKDPSYAEAYAGLAESYDLLPQFGNANLGASLSDAKQAADRAIELNPNLASAHTAKAFALFFGDWDITASDREFSRALVLDPDSAQTHQWYASTLQSRLEGEEAVKQIDEALRLNPTSPAIATDAAWFHALFGNDDSEIAALKEMDATQPNLSLPSQFLQTYDFFKGDFPAYVAETRHYAAITRRPDDLALADAIERGWNLGGKRGLLEAMAEAQRAAYQRGADNGFYLGETLVLLGRRSEALPYFRAALRGRTIPLLSMEQTPWAKSLANDPGYASLFADIRKLMHGDVAHPAVPPEFLRLPE